MNNNNIMNNGNMDGLKNMEANLTQLPNNQTNTPLDDNNEIGAKLLEVHAYDWTVKDIYGDDDHVAIHCWALDRESRPNLLRFTDFPAFCHVELPMFVRNRPYKWNNGSAGEFVKMLSDRLGDHAPTKYIFKDAKKTYYYRAGRRFPMLQLSFDSIRAMNRCSYLLADPIKTDDWGFIKCNVWEDSISIIRKLLTVRDVRYSQWFRAIGYQVEPELRVSELVNEYIVEWGSMKAIPLEECKEWTTKPGVLAFDIECYSNNHRAMPDKYNALHVAYMISCIYQRYKTPGTRRRFGIVIGDCNHIPPEKLQNCEIIRVNTEYEMIEAYARVVRETDPEIITGYNILGFDYPYLDHRVKRILKQWPSMGRISGEVPFMTSKTWHSGAYGHQSINILQMEGRISIDLLPIVKRDYKLDKYDLNTVCKKFIGKTKHDVKAPEMFLIYEDVRNTLTALVAILREEQNNPELSNNFEFVARKTAAQNAYETAKTETTRVMEYCIQDSELVIELMEKMNIWVGLIEMSNIVGTTIVELFTRGQQVRCLSQLYDLAARLGFILDKRDTPGFKFAGGFVYEPIPGVYDNIICLDFASLYPSIMMAYNICYTTLVPPELENVIPDEDCHVIEFDQDEIDGAEDDEDEDEEECLKEINEKKKKTKTVTRHYRFKYYKKQEGLLPRLVRQLVTERRAVNRQIVQIKDELKALEKTEDIRAAIEGYLNGTIQIMDIKTAKQRVKDFSESKPPAPPEVITAAKRDLMVAQLFNVAATTEKLNELIEAKPPTHPDLIALARSELRIAQLQHDNNRDGLIEYLNQLNATREQRLARIESSKILIVVLDKRQLAIKVSANSFFGFLGVHNGGKMPLIEGAMSITATGRRLIGLVRKYIEDNYGGVQIYGDTDSIRGHCPVLIRYSTGAIDYVQIKDLISLPAVSCTKEYYDLRTLNLEVWTDKGWSKITYLMRHKTLKKLYRVVTHTGIVDVTEDHSLLNEHGKEITPNEITTGMKLLHNNLPNVEYPDASMDEDKAWVWGFFMAEGSCGSYDYTSGTKNVWAISNQNHDFLNRAQHILRRIEPNYDFVIDPCMKSSNVDKLNARGNDIPGLVAKYNQLFYTQRSTTMKQNAATDLGIRFKKVPCQILMAPNNIKMAFLQGWYDGDGAKKEGNSRRFDINGQIGAAGLFHLATAVGYKVSINTRTDKEEIYRITLTNNTQRRDTDKIKKIIPMGYSLEDVFDIETENHHFGAGIGRMIVHNSVMMDLHIKDPKECNYWGLRLSQEISGIKPGEKDCDGKLWPDGRPGLFPPPLAMEFEKAMRLLCIKKKKYAAFLIGKDGNFKTEDVTDKHGNVIGNRLIMLKKGIVLARRDNCVFLRNTYTRILDMIMNGKGLGDAIAVLVDAIQNLLDGKVPYEDLVIIRELGANYKSDSYFMKVFSDQLKKAGKIVNPGDRLDFVIVEDPAATLLGHKMRLTEQYLERLNTDNPERIDYNYYIEKVLMNPINQLFEVGFKDTISQLQHVSYRPTNRHKIIHLDRPVQIILKMRERGYDIKVFKDAVDYNIMKLKGLNPIVLNLGGTHGAGDNKPVQNVVTDNKPVQNIVIDNKPVQNIVVDNKPVQNIVVDNKPVQNIVVDNKPVQNVVTDNKPVQNIVIDKTLNPVVNNIPTSRTLTLNILPIQIKPKEELHTQAIVTSPTVRPPATPTLIMPRIGTKPIENNFCQPMENNYHQPIRPLSLNINQTRIPAVPIVGGIGNIVLSLTKLPN